MERRVDAMNRGLIMTSDMASQMVLSGDNLNDSLNNGMAATEPI
jgi:hypothetical protein